LNNLDYIYEGNRLKFRRIDLEDYTELAEMLTDPEVMYAWEHTFTREQIIEWIDRQLEYYRQDGVGYFDAISKETREFIGKIGLHYSDFEGNRVLEGSKAWISYAKEQLGANEVYAFVRSTNLPSVRVAERAGMKVDGSFIKHYNDKDMEHLVLSIKLN